MRRIGLLSLPQIVRVDGVFNITGAKVRRNDGFLPDLFRRRGRQEKERLIHH